MTAERTVEGPRNKRCEFSEVAAIVERQRQKGETVGLITGCFDILHIGHIDLLRQAKRYVQFLVVGVESDQTLGSKGPERPINELDWRCDTLAELQSVDPVFPIEFTIDYRSSSEIDELYAGMYQHICPDCLITNTIADDYWRAKQERAQNMNIVFIGLGQERRTSTTDIIRKLSGGR